jgi:AraC-like DNA-binding protein
VLFGACAMSKSGLVAGDDPAHASTGAVEFSGPLPADLVRAIGWLRDHLSEPVRLDILAQNAGVRPRTLETHFKTFLGTTPLGWVRRMRLARARQEFIRWGSDAKVTTVAIGAGFTQLGRFAAEYRKAFGELPSTTVQRARNSSPQRFDQDFDEAIRLTLAPYRSPLLSNASNAMQPSTSCAVHRSWPPTMDCPGRLLVGVGRSVRPTISVRPRMRIANKPAVWRNGRTISHGTMR